MVAPHDELTAFMAVATNRDVPDLGSDVDPFGGDALDGRQGGLLGTGAGETWPSSLRHEHDGMNSFAICPAARYPSDRIPSNVLPSVRPRPNMLEIVRMSLKRVLFSDCSLTSLARNLSHCGINSTLVMCILSASHTQ